MSHSKLVDSDMDLKRHWKVICKQMMAKMKIEGMESHYYCSRSPRNHTVVLS